MTVWLTILQHKILEMGINNIPNYKYPNFGALVFRPNASHYLSTLGKKAISDVDIVRENLKDTEYFNLEIADTPVIRNIINKDKMYPPYTLSKAGNNLFIRGRCGAQTVSHKLKLNTKKEVDSIHKDIVQSETQIMRTGKIVKYLDEYAKKDKLTIYNFI